MARLIIRLKPSQSRIVDQTQQSKQPTLASGSDQLSQQQEVARARQGLRPALQHGPGGREGDVDRAAQIWERYNYGPLYGALVLCSIRLLTIKKTSKILL
jgi:hypothetical protein